jgi:flagellar hook-associated protein 1 FlgK
MGTSLGSLMNSALKSMAANQLALSVASNNIANAENTNFTRQRLITVPTGPDVSGIGTGVDVIGIDAVRDALVEMRLKQEISAKAGDDALTNGLQNVEVLFNDTENTGVLQTLSDFFNSFHSLSLDPASANFRQEVKTKAQTLINTFHGRNRDLKTIQTTADKAVSAHVDQINLLGTQIASLTSDIQFQEVAHRATDLRDRREALVKQLSEIVEIRELESNGEYQLTTKDNRLLVINGMTQTLKTSDVTSGIGNGQLKAQLAVRDQYVPKYLDALDQLAFEISTQVNAIHAAAYDQDGSTGNNFFTPLATASGASRLIELSASVSSDTRNIAASSLSTGNDNNAAVQLANLLHQPVFTGGSLTDQYRSMIFTIGTDVATSEANFREHDALATQLQNRRQSISGVSIDEETVQMLQFQRAYEASARLIRIVDELLQTTLALGG